jgi:Gas vesicle synthesis protein GvpL/GvpF
MIYLYAITDAVPPHLSVAGVDGAPVESSESDGLHAAWSAHADDADLGPTPTRLWAHEAVIDELLPNAAVLPLRFGTTLRDADAVRDLLQRERARFQALLDRVRGYVELAVRVALPSPTVQPTADGTGYVNARLASRQAREAVAEAVLAPLDAVATATARRRDEAPVIRASYLVRPDDVERFTSTVRRLQDAHPQLTLSCTGPWAPYSFVAEGSR